MINLTPELIVDNGELILWALIIFLALAFIAVVIWNYWNIK